MKRCPKCNQPMKYTKSNYPWTAWYWTCEQCGWACLDENPSTRKGY